ncbi:unnamed protein product [Camellia sinensis]
MVLLLMVRVMWMRIQYCPEIRQTWKVDPKRAVSITPSTAHQLIQGNKRNDTICIALADDTCDQPKIRMNNVVITPSFRIGDGWNVIWETSEDYILNF